MTGVYTRQAKDRSWADMGHNLPSGTQDSLVDNAHSKKVPADDELDTHRAHLCLLTAICLSSYAAKDAVH